MDYPLNQVAKWFSHYIGQQMQGYLKEVFILQGVSPTSYGTIHLHTISKHDGGYDPHIHKLLLRSLSTITEDELRQLIYLDWPTLHDFVTRIELPVPIKANTFGTGRNYVGFDKDNKHFITATLSMVKFNAEQFQYLLDNGFDLFGLIEKGLAIEKVMK